MSTKALLLLLLLFFELGFVVCKEGNGDFVSQQPRRGQRNKKDVEQVKGCQMPRSAHQRGGV